MQHTTSGGGLLLFLEKNYSHTTTLWYILKISTKVKNACQILLQRLGNAWKMKLSWRKLYSTFIKRKLAMIFSIMKNRFLYIHGGKKKPKKKKQHPNQVLWKTMSLFLEAFKSKLHFQVIYEATSWGKYLWNFYHLLNLKCVQIRSMYVLRESKQTTKKNCHSL